MKKNVSTISIALLIFAIIIQFVLNYKSEQRLKRQASIERIKAEFALRQSGIQEAPYDSVYAQYDTVSFYKNGVFLGKTIIVTD